MTTEIQNLLQANSQYKTIWVGQAKLNHVFNFEN